MTDLAIESAEQADSVNPRTTIDPSELTEGETQALRLVEEICAAASLDVSVVVRSLQPPYISIEILGQDAGLTFGRSGASLDALQLLCNMVLPRITGSEVRLMLDAEGYRERRMEALRRRAVDLAREVKERNQEAELEPLPAHERRIIHAVLAEDTEISTYSEGDEPNRRVVISPIPR